MPMVLHRIKIAIAVPAEPIFRVSVAELPSTRPMMIPGPLSRITVMRCSFPALMNPLSVRQTARPRPT